MRQSKHTLPKQSNKRNGQKTPKHKVPKAPVVVPVVDKDDMQVVNELAEAAQIINKEVVVNPRPVFLKTKEVQKQIREQRKKKNVGKNLYKVRMANVSSKHGPRAVNRSAIM